MKPQTPCGAILATLEERAACAARVSVDDDERRECVELRNQLKLYRAGEYMERLLDADVTVEKLGALLRRLATLPAPLPFCGPLSVAYRLTCKVSPLNRCIEEMLLRSAEAVPDAMLCP